MSVSLGSSARDACAELELLGERVLLERRGVDGDSRRAAALFAELDGEVDALGVGGADLWVETGRRRYPLRATHRMIRGVRRTPVVDGIGLKTSLESQVVRTLVEEVDEGCARGRVLLTCAVDRFGLARAFLESDYEVVFGDAMFCLGLPIPLRGVETLNALAALFMPLGSRLPSRLLYPTGAKQHRIVPRFGKWYAWATVIAGDCHFIKRHLPANLEGKVIVTNTTTRDDLALFRERGVRCVLTTTPVLNGRSFGTNAVEAALTAAAGLKRALTPEEIPPLIRRTDIGHAVFWP